MTKTYNFYKSNSNDNNTGIFLGSSKHTDYSSILDDIIATDIINKNSYLFDYNKKSDDDLIDALIGNNTITFTGSYLKDSDFAKAAKFLSGYKKYKKTYNLPYILGKMYTLSDGTPIIFYDDEIQIGFDTFKYSDFNNYSFLNNLTAKTKKIIINIYTFGTNNIEINLL